MTEREDLDRVAERLAESLGAPRADAPVPDERPGEAVVADVTLEGDAVATDAPEAGEATVAARGPVDVAQPDRVVHDAAVASVAGQHVSVSDSAVGVVAAGRMQADDSLIVVATIGRLEGNARVLFDLPGALAFGAACGVVLALLGRILGGRRG